MTEYIVVAAMLGVPTGEINRLSHLPDIVWFRKGQTVDSSRFDNEAGRDKIERLLRQGALRDPDDQEAPKAPYSSPFDIPLDRDPGGGPAVPATPEQPGVVRLEGDDVDDEDDDSEPVKVPEPVEEPEVEEPEPGEPVEEEAENVPSALPPAPSRGASTAVWQQYAEQAGLEVPPDAGRDQIVAAYDARVAEQG